MIMCAQVEHQKCVETTISYFTEREITCTDFEKYIGVGRSKRPDLWLPTFNTLLEVKTFPALAQEVKEARRVVKEMREGKVSAYELPTFYDRFGDHLRRARQKFRVYPTYHTAVIFYDLHSFVHEQTPEDLILGQEYITLAVPQNPREQITTVGAGRNNRHLRRDRNTEIGAVVFHTGDNSFKIFHHYFAEKIRRINKDVFARPENQHFEFIDDSVNPRIIQL